MRSYLFIFFLLSTQHLFGLGLIDRNPFVWEGYASVAERVKAPVNNPNNSQYEFSGVFSIGSKYFVLINELRKPGRWHKVPSSSEDLEIQSFNPQESSVQINTGSKSVWLQLKQLSENSNPIPIAGQVANSNSNRAAVQDSSARKVRTSVRRRVVRPSRSSSSSSSSSSITRRESTQARSPTSSAQRPPAAMVRNRGPITPPSFVSSAPDSKPPRSKPTVDSSVLENAP